MLIQEKFEREVFISQFYDPRENFQQVDVQGEVRKDPVTGLTGHIAHFSIPGLPEPDLSGFKDPEARKKCPFCPELKEKVTPRFPDKIIPEGRLQKNQTLLVPNISPYDVHSSLVIMSENHFLPLEELSEEVISDSLSLAWEYFRRVHKFDPSLEHCLLGWNYMPPSGGTIVHPHLQAIVTHNPGNLYSGELEAAEKHYQEHSSHLWDDFRGSEKRAGQRYIGTHVNLEWYTCFISQGMWGEVLAVYPEKETVGDLNDSDLADLAKGLQHLFRYFRDCNLYSFNLAFYPGSTVSQGIRPHVRITPRFYLNSQIHAPDISVFQLMYREPLSIVWPEDLCTQLQKYFGTYS